MEWLFIVFVLVIIGGWVYSDAKERGSGYAVLWAIGVMAMMIIFLPLYFVCRPSKKLTIETIVANKPVTLCPHCGKYYEGFPKFCPNCGNSINDLAVLQGKDSK